MEQAAKDAQQQQADQAAKQGQQAADSLSAAAQSLEQTRRQMAENWKQETQQALNQATNEALSLAQRQASISKKMNPSHDACARHRSPSTTGAGMSAKIFGQPSSSRPVRIGSAMLSHSTGTK